MADNSYKSSLLLGVQLQSANEIQTKLNDIIKSLNNTKIDLDINIKNSDVSKQLETLTNLANNFKSSLGGNVSLGNINEVINQATSAMSNLNGEVLKVTTTRFNNGEIGKQVAEISTGIGTVVKQMQSLQDGTLVETAKTITTNNAKIKQSIDDIANAQQKLNQLEKNGFADKNKVADLQNMFSNSNNFSSDNELKKYLEQIKQLESEEQNLKLIQDSNNKELEAQYKQQQQDLKELQQLEQQRMKEEQDLINAMASGREKSQLKTQQTDRTNELNQAKAINQALEEQQQILQKQSEAYKQIDVLKSNGIISESEISKLEKMVQEANSLKDIKNALNSIMSTSMMNESSIVSLSKQLDDAQIKLEKMKQSFGTKLPNGFVESTQTEINKLREELKNVDGMNFNGIKNGLNQINTSMKVTTNETQQLVNSLKETNNSSFFSGLSNFLSKVGIFYGVQQVVQEITSQLKDAVNYTIEMDKSMTNMQMITGKSKGEIVDVVNNYKQLGEQLHTTNAEMMKGMEEVTRAGFDGKEGESLMSASIIGSKLSGQTTAQVTEQLIAIKNAFNMTGEGMQNVVDMMSKMDNVSATSFAEIATAIQRTAFSAQEAGTPLSNLITYITTVSEKTRKSASTINKLVA